MNYFIIDGFNLAYRAHNANFELKTSDNKPTGMFFGFIRMIFSLKKKYQGYKFIVVWDNKPVKKYAINPEYKAGRTSLPQLVTDQVPDIKEYLRNSGVEQREKEEEEADDIIATLVEMLSQNEGCILIYTNDRDMLQLVENGKVVVFKPKVGNSLEKFYDEKAVIDEYGVSAKQLAVFRSFDGDQSDNLKGISRVPRKIIASMVTSSNDIDSIYKGLVGVKLTEFQRESLIEGQERVRKNYEIIKLNRAVADVLCDEPKLNKDKITELLKKYEIKSINPEHVIDLFSSSLNIKYSDARPSYKLESYSLFD